MSSSAEKRRHLGASAVGLRLLELSVVLKQLHQQAADTDRRMLKDIQADILPDGHVDKTKAGKTEKATDLRGRIEKEQTRGEKLKMYTVKLGLMSTFVQLWEVII